MHKIVEHGCESQFSRSDLKAMLQPTPRRSLPSSSARGSEAATREQLYGGSKARQIARNEERGASGGREGGGRIREERRGREEATVAAKRGGVEK